MRRREDARGRSRLRYSFHSVDDPWSDYRAVGAGEALKLVVEIRNLVEEDQSEIVESFGVVDVDGGAGFQEIPDNGDGGRLADVVGFCFEGNAEDRHGLGRN